jgi:hypothetical protein
MSRLFVFGDSWAFNYFSKESIDRPEQIPHLNSTAVAGFAKEFNYFGHWTDYLKPFYDIYNYAEGGCCNEDIVHQLGFLPEYVEGDRLIIIFTNPSRFQWMVNGKRKTLINGLYWKSQLSELEKHIYDSQMIERTDLWLESNERDIEKNFIKKIPIFFKNYNPILISWSRDMTDVIDCIIPIANNNKYTTISKESSDKYNDGHMGINGNYELYKFVSKKLGIEIDPNNEYRTIDKSII